MLNAVAEALARGTFMSQEHDSFQADDNLLVTSGSWLLLLERQQWLGVVLHACPLSTWDAEAGGFQINHQFYI